MSFDLTQRIKVVNPHADVDELYGPYNSITEALSKVPMVLRAKGRTVGIVVDGGVVEYWFKYGVADSNLIEKHVTTNGGNTGGGTVTPTPSFVHEQTVESMLWTVTHNMDKYPSVTVIGTDDIVVHGQVTYNGKNSLSVSFNKVMTGKLVLN